MAPLPQADWADELAGRDAAEARAELVAMGPKAVPLLLEVFETEELSASFQAAVVFAELGDQGKAAVPALIKGALDDSGPVEVRSYYALALVGSESSAKKVAPAMLKLLGGDTEAKLAKAAQVTLSMMGKGGVAPTMRVFSKEDKDATLVLRTGGVLVALAPEASVQAKALGKCVADNRNGVRGLLSILVLEAIGKKGVKPLEQGLRKRQGPSGPPIPIDPTRGWGASVLPFLRGQIKDPAVKRTGLSAPEVGRDLIDDGAATIPELIACWSGHLGLECQKMGLELIAGTHEDRKAWNKRVAPVERSDAFMDDLVAR